MSDIYETWLAYDAACKERGVSSHPMIKEALTSDRDENTMWVTAAVHIQGGPKKPDYFLEVCNSRICWHRIALCMNVITKISCYFERNVITVKLRKEYLNTVTCNTPVLLWMKSWTVWYIERNSMATYIRLTNFQKTVRFFGPPCIFMGSTYRTGNVVTLFIRGIGLAIHRSRVRVLAGHHCVVTLGKLLTPVCLCHQAV